MNSKPSLLLCITSCRFKDPGRSIQLAGLRAHSVPYQEPNRGIGLSNFLAGRQNSAFPEIHTIAISPFFGGHEIPIVHYKWRAKKIKQMYKKKMVTMVFALIKLIGRESLIKSSGTRCNHSCDEYSEREE